MTVSRAPGLPFADGGGRASTCHDLPGRVSGSPLLLSPSPLRIEARSPPAHEGGLMRRRAFLQAAGLATYSLMVLADGPVAAAGEIDPEERRRWFDRIAPPG